MSIALVSRLDTAAAGPLRLALKTLIEEARPLDIDGNAVDQIGQAGLQVLVAARAAAAANGLPYQVSRPSRALVEAAGLAALNVLDAA